MTTTNQLAILTAYVEANPPTSFDDSDDGGRGEARRDDALAGVSGRESDHAADVYYAAVTG